MHRESRSILFACTLGAFIGSLVSLELAHHFTCGPYLWPVGALLGGIVGWMTVDFKELCYGVRLAWRRAVNWNPDREWWKTFGMTLATTTVMLSIPGLLFSTILKSATPDHVQGLLLVACIILCIITIVVLKLQWETLGVLMSNSPQLWVNDWSLNRDECLQEIRRVEKFLMLWCNPIGVVVGICIGFWTLFQFVRRMAVGTPSAVMRATRAIVRITPPVATALKNFAIGIFVNVHSARRKICFVDSAIGATVGYHFGSALVGAVAGALLGVVNFELVSIRWLKIVPAR